MNRTIAVMILAALAALGTAVVSGLLGVDEYAGFPSLLAVLIVFWGVESWSLVVGTMLALVGELLGGYRIGLLALPFLAMAGLLQGSGRFVAFRPLASQEGRSVANTIFVAMFALGIRWGMALATFALQSLLGYDGGAAWGDAARMALDVRSLWVSAAEIVIYVALFRLVASRPARSF